MSKKRTGARRYGDPRKRQPVTGDLRRLIQPTGAVDPRTLGGEMIGPGGPRDRGAVLLDTTDAVILDGVDVATVDPVRAGAVGPPVVFMTLDGRVNRKTDRARVGFIFPADGAAAIITELLAIADRFGAELLDELTRRFADLAEAKNIDLHFVRAAIDNAIEKGNTV